MEVKDLYVILDSWGAGYNDETGQDKDGWAQQLGIPDDHILAVSGSTAADWSHGKHRPLLDSIPENATVVCFMGGNDARAATSDGVVSLAEKLAIFSSLHAVCTVLSLKGCCAIVCSYEDPYMGTIPEMAVGLTRLNSALHAVAVFHGFEFLDLHHVMDEDHFLPPAIVAARTAIHPNTKGYTFIAENIAAMLEMPWEHE